MKESNESILVLSSVQLPTSGLYRCEVSGEAPYFETIAQDQQMTVVGKSKFTHLLALINYEKYSCIVCWV